MVAKTAIDKMSAAGFSFSDILGVIKLIGDAFKTDKPPVPVPGVPGPEPVTPVTPVIPIDAASHKAVVTKLQAILKKWVAPELVVDGWWGEKTDKALADGIAMAEKWGFGG